MTIFFKPLNVSEAPAVSWFDRRLGAFVSDNVIQKLGPLAQTNPELVGRTWTDVRRIHLEDRKENQ